MKGSPEKIRELSDPATIPLNYHSILNKLAKSGYRVIACGSRPLKCSYRNLFKLEREKVESNLQFIGFLIMENKLKPISKQIISTLTEAGVRNIMATGDNILTAISVSR